MQQALFEIVEDDVTYFYGVAFFYARLFEGFEDAHCVEDVSESVDLLEVAGVRDVCEPDDFAAFDGEFVFVGSVDCKSAVVVVVRARVFFEFDDGDGFFDFVDLLRDKIQKLFDTLF